MYFLAQTVYFLAQTVVYGPDSGLLAQLWFTGPSGEILDTVVVKLDSVVGNTRLW